MPIAATGGARISGGAKAMACEFWLFPPSKRAGRGRRYPGGQNAGVPDRAGRAVHRRDRHPGPAFGPRSPPFRAGGGPGGQLMGQMIMAAAGTLPDKNIKSIHAIFARAGTVTQPVDLDVDVMHNGRALGSVCVTARQGDRLLSRGLLLLDAGEPDLIRHSLPMPQVARPDQLEVRKGTEEGSHLRIVDEVDLMTADVTGDPELFVWVRWDHAPGGQAIHQALLSWYTDPFLIGASMRPHAGIGPNMAHDP